MSIRTNYFFETGGFDFESKVVDVVSTFAKREWGIGAVKFSTVQQDRYEGTDIFVLKVPIDVTLAFEKKEQNPQIGRAVFGRGNN